MSRLVIDVSAEEHQKIKALSALQGKSIKEYVLGKVFVEQDDGDDAMETLKLLLADRIEEAEQDEYSTKSFTQIAQDAVKKKHKH